MVPTSDELATLAARRARVMEALGDGVLLLAAAPERLRAGDVHYPYRQDSDFDYVTGFPEPEAVCLLAPGEATERFVLFVRPHDPERAVWVGPRAGVDGAVERWGADAAYPLDELEKRLADFLGRAPTVALSLTREDALANRLLAAVRRAQAERPRTGTGPTAVRDVGEVLHEMRLRKDPEEIARLRAAIAIACEAHREAMRATRPGMVEYEIEALIDYTFRRRGAAGPAYPSIVASGANATILHYTDNVRALGPDELLLVDAGAERAGYCADVTRTFPTGPRYTPAQRDVYDAVLAAQLAALAAARPGVTLEDLHTKAVRVLTEALVHLRLLDASVDEAIEKELYRRFYMHRTSHWLGRDVHDVGRYKDQGTPRPLEPGMVFTVEPGLYIPSDADDLPAAFRGLGVRIEDDVLVTDTGHEVLSAAAPKQAEEVESLRAEAAAAVSSSRPSDRGRRGAPSPPRA
ncbi:MAG TPA: aminopeptidase P N-terminal domain-containing protein [Candidatus Binatia bacterium]|nr:aminopeptidase P N-terminal domain-containing protein [Candidatus Binatia bacterium]